MKPPLTQNQHKSLQAFHEDPANPKSWEETSGIYLVYLYEAHVDPKISRRVFMFFMKPPSIQNHGNNLEKFMISNVMKSPLIQD